MSTEHTVLLLGGSGRTGRRVLAQLLDRGVSVRAIVRSATKLPAEVLGDPRLTVTEADLLSLTDHELHEHVLGCDTVISTLGHVLSLKGVFGRPRDLVRQATVRVCRAIETLRPAEPVRLILMSSVSVNRPDGRDTRRRGAERAFLWVLRGVLPPANDNQRAADFLCENSGSSNPYVRWVVVRPDTLLEGEVSEYAIHEGLVSSLAKPDSTNMANVAHFTCALTEDPSLWDRWMGKMPVIINAMSERRTLAPTGRRVHPLSDADTGGG